MTLGKVLMDILACPVCNASVVNKGEAVVCQNEKCGLKFPVKNGIPVMLVEEVLNS